MPACLRPTAARSPCGRATTIGSVSRTRSPACVCSQDRPRQAQDARAFACISTRIGSVPFARRPRGQTTAAGRLILASGVLELRTTRTWRGGIERLRQLEPCAPASRTLTKSGQRAGGRHLLNVSGCYTAASDLESGDLASPAANARRGPAVRSGVTFWLVPRRRAGRVSWPAVTAIQDVSVLLDAI